jgi:hypothetical protein
MSGRNNQNRVNVWIDNRLHFMAKEAGIDFTVFFTRCLTEFFDLPPDPRKELINKKADEVVLRLRVQYQNEMRQLAKQQMVQDPTVTAADLRAAKLLELGEALQELSFFPQLKRDLERKNPEDSLWEDALVLVNSKNGNKYTFSTLWSDAIDWYTRYGKTQCA